MSGKIARFNRGEIKGQLKAIHARESKRTDREIETVVAERNVMKLKEAAKTAENG